MTYDLMDITGPVSMIVKGPGNYGILIMSGGSLSQTFDGELVGAELTSEAGGHVAYNEGGELIGPWKGIGYSDYSE